MPARGVFRGVYSVLFDDPDYQQLPSQARLVLVTVRLCFQAGVPVIFTYSVDTLMRQTGYRRHEVEAALTILQDRGWIDRDPSLLWVRNGLKYDPFMRHFQANPKQRSAVIRWLEGLPKRPIVLKFCDYYDLPYPFDRVSIGSLKEKEKEKDKKLEAGALDAPASSRPAPPVSKFKIPPPIAEAVAKCPTFATVPRLLDPSWWQAEVMANNERGVPYAAEVLKAQAWIVSNPKRAPRANIPSFLHRWFARANGGDP